MEREPLVLLIQPINAVHDQTVLLRRLGFHVEASADDRISERDVLDIASDLIAVELAARSAETLDLARGAPRRPANTIDSFGSVGHAVAV